jgi:hypothetical protein
MSGQVKRGIGSCDQRIKWATAELGCGELAPAMKDFAFKVNLVAVVRVRADDESVARKIVPTVLGAPGTVEIRLANENNAARGHHATVTDVDFSIGSVKPLKAGSREDAKALLRVAESAPSGAPAPVRRHKR